MSPDNTPLPTSQSLSLLYAESSASAANQIDVNKLLLASSQQDFDASCLLSRMGGDGVLINLMRTFYELVADDPVLAPFLERTDVSNLKSEQTQFLTLLLGNKLPDDFDVTLFLIERHLPLFESSAAIDQEHFDLFVGYLPEACEEHDVEPDIADELMDTFLPFGKIFDEQYRDRKIRHFMLKTAQKKIDARMEGMSEPTRGRMARTASGEGIIKGMRNSTIKDDGGGRQRPTRTSGRAERSQSLQVESSGVPVVATRTRPSRVLVSKRPSRSKSANMECLDDETIVAIASAGTSSSREPPARGVGRKKSGDKLKAMFMGHKKRPSISDTGS